MSETGRKVVQEWEVTSPSVADAAGSRADSAGVARRRMRGTMLWFNAEQDLGALRTHGGDQIEIAGDAFVPGEKPVGRCAGKAIEFQSLDGAVSGITFVHEPSPRRARLRHRG